MKLKTNFSYDVDNALEVFVKALWGGVFLALLGAGLICHSVLSLSHRLPGLKEEVSALAQKPIPTPSKDEELSPDALATLRREAAELNSLNAPSGLSLSSLLARLEKDLPVGARLLGFQQDGRSGDLQLTVEAVGLEELSRFLEALQSDPVFSKVALTKQSGAQQSQANWIQFTVDMTVNRP